MNSLHLSDIELAQYAILWKQAIHAIFFDHISNEAATVETKLKPLKNNNEKIFLEETKQGV